MKWRHVRVTANIILNLLRYYFTYQEPMPVEQLVAQVSDLKQGYTQYGGMLFHQSPERHLQYNYTHYPTNHIINK